MKKTLAIALLTASLTAWAAPDAPLDAPARAQVARELARQLRERYVFPDRVAGIEPALQAAAADATEPPALAEKLTAALAEATQDKHLRVTVTPEQPGGTRAEAADM